MKKIVFYFHNGCFNHGCEALCRSIYKIIKNNESLVYSFNTKEDVFYGLNKVLEVKSLDIVHSHKLSNRSKIYKKLPRTLFAILKFFKQLIFKKKEYVFNEQQIYNQFKNLLIDENDIFLSIGGDNYCYGLDFFNKLIFINKTLNQRNKKTVLFGCSIEPKDIKENKVLQEDLKIYSLITARESLTYNALIESGINKNTHLFPDPAFLLDKEIPNDLPNNFIPNNTIGLNLSPMVQNLEKGNNIAYKNFVELIKYIINSTNMNIALIPHVVWETNNDLEPLTKLYNQFKRTNRVCLIDKPYNACQLKGIISQCRFMIAARTHASIAAYSTQVPTLVIGYSVKAKGIAKDIFGDYKDYVLPVQELKDKTEVLEAFKKLMQNEDKIREHYKSFMPNYIERTWLAGKEVEKLLNN